jgi:hypothetical protein
MLRGNSKVQQRDVIAGCAAAALSCESLQLVKSLQEDGVGSTPFTGWFRIQAGVTLRHGLRVGDSYNQQAKRNQKGGRSKR